MLLGGDKDGQEEDEKHQQQEQPVSQSPRRSPHSPQVRPDGAELILQTAGAQQAAGFMARCVPLPKGTTGRFALSR
eukprot:7367872-Pyramimonas_sp.AAC.1